MIFLSSEDDFLHNFALLSLKMNLAVWDAVVSAPPNLFKKLSEKSCFYPPDFVRIIQQLCSMIRKL